MSPQFDLQSDDHFFETLSELGADIANFVLDDLLTVASALSWSNFVKNYHWREHVRVPVDTYPGETIYYCFDVTLSQNLIKGGKSAVVIYATNYGDSLILCGVAK